MITCVTHSQTETLSIYMSLNTYLDIYMSIMHVLRRIPIKKNLDVLTLHTPYSGALVSGGAPLVDPRL
jgi:glutamine synthetase type III